MPYQPNLYAILCRHIRVAFHISSFLLLTLFSSRLQAQQVVFDKQICERRTSAELSTITDSTKKITCIFMPGMDSIRVVVLNDKMQEIKVFRLIRQQNEEPMGSCITNGIVYYYLNETRKREVHTWSLNYLTGETALNYQQMDMLKNLPDAQISTGNHFLYCTLNKKAKGFTVYDFQTDTLSSIISYHSPTLWDELTHTDGLSRDYDFTLMPAVGEPAVDIAASFKKLYLSGDSLYLLSNLQNGVTHIYCFNLSSKTATHRVLQHQLSKAEITPFDFKNNSFLLGNTLYYIWVNSEKMGIEITDFATGRVIKKYEVAKKEDITFKNTPIIQEGGGAVFFSGGERELEATSKLIRKMHRGRPVITASQSDSGRIAILVGSYLETPSPGAGFPGFSPVGGPTFTVPTGFFFRNGAVKSARFKMLTNQANEFVPGDMPQSLNEKIEAYTDEQKLTTNSENLFTANGNTYYAYYYKKEGRLVVMKW